MLWLPPGTLVFVYGFPCGGLIEDPRVWILLRTRGVLGMVPGDPGNPCFPTNSCGACQSGVSSEALSFLTGDIYLEERLNGKFMVSARSLQKSVPCSGFMKKIRDHVFGGAVADFDPSLFDLVGGINMFDVDVAFTLAV